MDWTIWKSAKVKKQINNLNPDDQETYEALEADIRKNGPIVNWPNFQKNKGTGRVDCYHCHLVKGNPTLVAMWRVLDKKMKRLEMRYVGTHENVDYRRNC